MTDIDYTLAGEDPREAIGAPSDLGSQMTAIKPVVSTLNCVSAASFK